MKTKLKTIREEKGLTQAEIANKASIAVMTYQRYEAGQRIPNVHTALSIAKALNVHIEDLFSVAVPKSNSNNG